jgi:hypothetical protein
LRYRAPVTFRGLDAGRRRRSYGMSALSKRAGNHA